MRLGKRALGVALVVCSAFLCAAVDTHAQRSARRVRAPARQSTTATNAAATKTTATADEAGDRSLPEIKTRAEFDRLARVNMDAGYPLPHVMYVIDRKDRNRIYYVNSKRYRFHKDFINGTYLSLERGREFFENNYLKPNRRFILGTLAYQTPLARWTFEYWEGDLIPTEQIKLTGETINRTFFAPVAFKPNSIKQDEASVSIAGLARVSQSEIAREQEYQPLNLARGLGRIHIIKNLDEHVEIGFNEILVLDEVPVTLPPVAGIITSRPSTPLSHINLLAKSWGVPNAYVRNASELFKEYDGWWVSFETKTGKYEIKRADMNALNEYQRRLKERRDVMTPRFDLSEKRLADLRSQRASMADAYGAKSANLGEVANARLSGITVPNGFTIPIYYYDEFIKANELEQPIYEMVEDQKFVHDPAYRRERLAEMRARIQSAKMQDDLRAAILKRVRAEYQGKGLFVRSSTNAEDLPNFNGAGLYSTVPNVREEEKLIEAVKTVWASVWNFEAYEARERAGIDHMKVYPAVLIQEGVNADSAGVMITTDPYNDANRDAIYISAKRGLGIKVVEGKRIAEQIIFRPRSQAVRVLTRSDEESLLTFDDAGGVKEIPISGERAVLTDATVRRLARAASLIKRVFRGREQDIEWVFQGGQVYIVQSRPYIAGS
ncbi:MAG TPA: PEP/pyruvate-binding domain-containing protein [Pyrinomonadaceae bacterium]|jgi:hypothetical protein